MKWLIQIEIRELLILVPSINTVIYVTLGHDDTYLNRSRMFQLSYHNQSCLNKWWLGISIADSGTVGGDLWLTSSVTRPEKFLSWKQSFYLSWYMNPSPCSRMSCLDKTYRNVWCWNSKWLILQFELFSRSRCSFTYHYPFAALSAINVGNITLLTNYINCKLHKPEISESIRCSLMPSNRFTASSSSWDSRRLSFSSESESLWIELMF